MENRFIKLLTFSLSGTERVLLFGFSNETEQAPRPWRKKAVKDRREAWTAILTAEEEDRFCRRLTEVGDTTLTNGISLRSPELTARPPVLSATESVPTDGPVCALRRLTELWNTRKTGLRDQVEDSLGVTGKALYQSVQELLAWAKQECGVDFIKQGHRFGNFERYQRIAPAYEFDLEYPKTQTLTQLTLRCKTPVDRDLIVNCAAACRGRWLTDQVKVLSAGQQSLTFSAKEPMSHVAVWVWDKESGELVFSKDQTLITQLCINGSFLSTPIRISDPWSQKLLKSAADRGGAIRKQIETVQRASADRPTVFGRTRNILDEAMEQGHDLFSGYSKEPCRGAFIKNERKDGEIDSFLKLRQYIEAPGVSKVVIADPYFSVAAAGKMLFRVENTNVQLCIITALGEDDPDSGKKNDYLTQYRQFLRSNAHLLHGKLSIYCLRRGKDRVFHDRYLIQYFKNGDIRGYLLSNSINSMGRSYPFVIAPMEREVCIEVREYLDGLLSADVQGARRKEERVQCEVLWDSANKPTPPETAQSLPWRKQWMVRLQGEDGRLSVAREALCDALAVIRSHWDEDREGACRFLCELKGSGSWSCHDFAAALVSAESANAFLAAFSPLAEKIEAKRDHSVGGIHTPEYQAWALLKGQAMPSLRGWYRIFEDACHIYYSGESWLGSGYRLMLELDPRMFLNALENTASPLMFGTLTFAMVFYGWSYRDYAILSGSDLLPIRLLAAEWLFRGMREGEVAACQLCALIDSLPTPDNRMLQAAYVLSQIKFHARVHGGDPQRTEQWNVAYAQLLRTVARTAPLCGDEDVKMAVQYLSDCEDCSSCELYLHLADAAGDAAQKDRWLESAFRIIKNSLIHTEYEHDLSANIDLCLSVAEQLYGEKAEKEILGDKKLVSWEVFDTATEPALKNYNYHQWHRAWVRAQWQMQLLQSYQARHPGAEETGKWIKTWEDRLMVTRKQSGN